MLYVDIQIVDASNVMDGAKYKSTSVIYIHSYFSSLGRSSTVAVPSMIPIIQLVIYFLVHMKGYLPWTALKRGNSSVFPCLDRNSHTERAVESPCNFCPLSSVFSISSTETPFSTA